MWTLSFANTSEGFPLYFATCASVMTKARVIDFDACPGKNLNIQMLKGRRMGKSSQGGKLGGPSSPKRYRVPSLFSILPWKVSQFLMVILTRDSSKWLK